MKVKTTLNDLVTDNPDSFVLIEYNRNSSNHICISPSGELRKLGCANYGMHKRGNVFSVLKADQKAKPLWFKLKESPKPKKKRGRPKKKTVGSEA